MYVLLVVEGLVKSMFKTDGSLEGDFGVTVLQVIHKTIIKEVIRLEIY